jgi:hypothetical protein
LCPPWRPGAESVEHATLIKLDAERKAGEMLRRAPKQRPGQYQQRSPACTVDIAPKLEDLGVTKRQSSDWQAMA